MKEKTILSDNGSIFCILTKKILSDNGRGFFMKIFLSDNGGGFCILMTIFLSDNGGGFVDGSDGERDAWSYSCTTSKSF